MTAPGWGDSPEERAMDDEEEYRRGVYSTRYFRFANIVAEKVAKVFPDVKIHTYAYFSCEDLRNLKSCTRTSSLNSALTGGITNGLWMILHRRSMLIGTNCS